MGLWIGVISKFIPSGGLGGVFRVTGIAMSAISTAILRAISTILHRIGLRAAIETL
jgi:hypothetical protein